MLKLHRKLQSDINPTSRHLLAAHFNCR